MPAISHSSNQAGSGRAERFARRPAAGAALVLVLLAVYLPGLRSIPVVDRDEARFAQASRQMFEALALPASERDDEPIAPDADARLTGGRHAGGWAVPMVDDHPRLVKPPLTYWAQAGAAAVWTGGNPRADRIWHYRTPSVLAAIGACLIIWRLGVRAGEARAGLLGAALLGVCPMVVWDAHQARADQILLFTTTAAMAALFVIRSGSPARRARGWLAPLALWTAVGAGILTKGPVTPMVVGLAAASYAWVARDWGWLRRTRPILGACVLGAMLGPWVVASADAVGWPVMLGVWFDETIGRSAGAREGHWGPPGYHLVLLAVLFWPGSLLTLHAVLGAARTALHLPPDAGWRTRWRARTVADPATLFLLAWIVPAWLVFELIGTKLPHYTMPLYPPIALLTARAVLSGARPARSGLVLWTAIGLCLVVAAPIAVAWLGGGEDARAIAVAGGVVAGVLVLVAAWCARRGRGVHAHAVAVGAGVVFAGALLGGVLPRARALWVSEQIADLVPPGVHIGTIVYDEGSLGFSTRGRVERIPPDAAASWSDAHSGAVLVLPAHASPPAGAVLLGRATGVNYSKGERVDLSVYAIERE